MVTRLGLDGYGVKPVGSFSGKAESTFNPRTYTETWTRLGFGGYGIRKNGSFAGKGEVVVVEDDELDGHIGRKRRRRTEEDKSRQPEWDAARLKREAFRDRMDALYDRLHGIEPKRVPTKTKKAVEAYQKQSVEGVDLAPVIKRIEGLEAQIALIEQQEEEEFMMMLLMTE